MRPSIDRPLFSQFHFTFFGREIALFCFFEHDATSDNQTISDISINFHCFSWWPCCDQLPKKWRSWCLGKNFGLNWLNMYWWSIARTNVELILLMEIGILNGRTRRKKARMIQAINFASVIGSYLITELGQRSESVPISDGWTQTTPDGD